MLAFCHRLLALALALGLLAALPTIACAGPYEDALAHFAADDFEETAMGINAVAASGNPLAATVLEALQDGRLFFSPQGKTVFYRDIADALFDAATGTPAAAPAPADLAPVEINNRVRRVIEAALGAMSLMVGTADKRLEAAQAVFQSRDATALPALDQAIAKETDARVKKALTEARAAVVLNLDDATEADKIDAIGVIRSRGDQDAVGLLANVPAVQLGRGQEGRERRHVAALQNQLRMWSGLQNAWYGLSLGSVLALAAIGLAAITFGVMGVHQHGARRDGYRMLGAYTTFVVQEFIRTHSPSLFD